MGKRAEGSGSLLVAQHALGERRPDAGASFNISSMIIQSFPDFPHAAQAARWHKTARAARRPALNHSCIEGNPTGRVSTITAGLPHVEDALPYKRKARFSTTLVRPQLATHPPKSASGIRSLSISAQMGPQVCMQKGLCREFDDDCSDLRGADKPCL